MIQNLAIVTAVVLSVALFAMTVNSLGNFRIGQEPQIVPANGNLLIQTEDFKFAQDELHVSAGSEVKLALMNADILPHSFDIDELELHIISALTLIPLFLLFFTFPDGRFVPRWAWVPTFLISILAVLDPVLNAVGLTSPAGQFSNVLIILFVPAVLLGATAQIYRYRYVSKPIQRQQTKWVLIGFLCLMVPFLGWTLFVEIFPLPPGVPRLIFNTILFGVMGFFLMIFPVSFVIAIMRYRLWDIDLLIRRTLVYSMLTGSLLLVYFGSVVIVQTVVNKLTGQEQSSQLTIALSTLLIAALFNPLRRRIQDFIDRRFFRRKYDSGLVLARFAQSAQDEVDMEQLSAVVLNTVEETMQPEKISLWLKTDSP